MIVQKMEFSDVFAANCYFYADEKTKHGFIIDPAAHANKLLETIKNNDCTIEKILLTHSHLDHVGAALELSKALGVNIFGAENAAKYLSNFEFREHFTDWDVLKNMKYLSDGDEVVLSTNADAVLRVLSTPGHTIDSLVYYDEKENIAFTGDTLFAESVGRTDIPGSGGDEKTLMDSLRRVFGLPENTVIYPGHGDKAVLGLIFR